jgi:4-amino-4-deoxy-L-arabinose transferase-like glycosyltransferase
LSRGRGRGRRKAGQGPPPPARDRPTQPLVRSGSRPSAEKRTGGPHTLRRDLWTALALWAAAWGARLLFLHAHGDQDYPFSLFYYGDSRTYRELALALLDGRSYDSGLPFHPPLFGWLLAGVIRLVGARPEVIRALLAGVAALAVPLVWRLGLRLFDRATGWVAAVAATLSFGLMVAAVSPNVETVYVPLLAGQALAVVALADRLGADQGGRRPPWLPALAAGSLIGLGSLARAEHLAFFALVPAALLLAPGARAAAGRRRALVASAVALAAGAVVLAPWVLHAHRGLAAFNRANPGLAEPLPTWVAVTSYGPINFALANHPEATGGFEPRPIVGDRGAAIDLRDPRHLDFYLHGYRMGLGWIAERPGRALRLAGAKLGIALDGLGLGFGAADRPAGLAGTRRPVDLFTPDGARWWGLAALALAAAGGWLARHRWRRGAIVWLALAHKAAVCVVFFGYARLAVQVLPLVLLLQAWAVVVAVRRLPAPRWRRVAAAAGVAVAVLLALELASAAVSPYRFTVSGSADARGRVVQDAALRIAPAGRL